MDIETIKRVVATGESEILEFKSSTAKLDAIFQTLCAFLNGEGGTVLTGVKDDGRIVGQHISDSTNLEISNMIAKLEPPTPIKVDYIPFEDDKFVIQLTAVSSPPLKPYAFEGRPYWRVGSSTRPMPQQHYQRLLLDKAIKSHPWDGEVESRISLEDLDESEILNALKESIQRGRMKIALSTDDPMQALQTFGLLEGGEITRAAGILFCRDVQRKFPQAIIRLIQFKGVNKSIILDNQQVSGNAFVQVDAAEEFVMRHMSIGGEVIPGKMAREDYPQYSLRAVREAVVNAICHRDYMSHTGSISLMMYEDRLEITSPGILPQKVTVEKLKTTHDSIPRNAKITEVMYKRGLIESVGSGTQEMVADCKQIGSPEPEYFERDSTFVVLFYENSQVPSAIKLTLRQHEILKIMKQLGECTTSQIMDKMEVPPSDRTLRNDLSQLEEFGLAIREGEGRATSWKSKR